jgi:hypothetical protein
MILLAQIPGADQAIQAAAASGRWEAVALVVVMMLCLAFLVWIVKVTMQQAHERESRLTSRIDQVEDYAKTTLKEVADKSNAAMLQLSNSVAENTRVVAELIVTLHSSRACFMLGESQDKMIVTIADKVVERIILSQRKID